MEQNTRILKCLRCGKEIRVPEELETFSCVFCGEKMSLHEILAAEHLEANVEDLRFAQTHLFDCIRNYPDYYRNFSKKNYESSFQSYVCGIEDAFHAMDRYICANPTRREELIEGFVDQFLKEWQTYHSQQLHLKRKAAVDRAMFNSKLTLAWYTVPAILYLDLSAGPEFTELLQQKFTQRYPDNIFRVGSYSDLSQGFRKRGLCFITTAVCESEGKPDDCEELMAFRSFRDGWLANAEGGRELIDAYYELAPAIVQAIALCDDSKTRCAAIRRDYLVPCFQALQAEDPTLCRSIYVRMVQDLAGYYGLC